MEIREIGMAETEDIKRVINEAFSAPPWNDDWSDDANFTLYIKDIIGGSSSLSFGLFEKERMIGLCLGRIKHWFNGAEYVIDDICVCPDVQGQGIGSCWLAMVEDALREHGVARVGLLTRRDAPAFGFYRKNGYDEALADVWMKKEL